MPFVVDALALLPTFAALVVALAAVDDRRDHDHLDRLRRLRPARRSARSAP